MNPVSVIIVSWNARRYLHDCLVSIRETGVATVGQIIVVDNASNDGSPELVAQDFPEVELIQTGANLGFARANNIGLKRASGAYVALINSDVIVHEKCIERLVEFLDHHAPVGLVGPKIVSSDGQVQPSCRRLPSPWNTACRALALDGFLAQHPWFSGQAIRNLNPEAAKEVEVLSGCFWLARHEALAQVGGLDERFFFYAEDLDWCKRMRDAGWKVAYVPQASATHFGGASSANAPLRYSIELLRANLIYWRKHRGWLGQAYFYVLSVLHHSLRLVAHGSKQLLCRNPGGENDYKRLRSFICLRWLVTGKDASRCAVGTRV
jgi:GT2 family glycosyltransferase